MQFSGGTREVVPVTGASPEATSAALWMRALPEGNKKQRSFIIFTVVTFLKRRSAS